MTADALVEASAYGDRAEVAWFSKVNDPNMTFGSFAVSGADRIENLDMLLSNMLQNKIGKTRRIGSFSCGKGTGHVPTTGRLLLVVRSRICCACA